MDKSKITTVLSLGSAEQESPRKIQSQDRRVETGVVQFGDDWPGVFIRGDCAFGYAMYLRFLLKNTTAHDDSDIIATAGVQGLLSLLESCNVNSE
jgi:hypothetical protein